MALETSETYALIAEAQKGGAAARDRLVEDNLGLVRSVAKKFYGRGHESDDLFQIGAIGLIKAITKFDATFGVRFSTYAVPMIMGEIKRFIRDDGIIKVSRSLKELNAKGLSARETLTRQLNREPTVREIAEEVGVEAEELVAAMDAVTAPDSLFAERGGTGGDGRPATLFENVAADGCLEDEVTRKIALQQTLARCKARERQVIMLRYFAEKTQSQIGKMLGISQVQVSRIESRVLKEMRKNIN
ncbi:MAG: SigB/SigF/SigG family RNA polymerase sigma factor [Clostridiales bacterium]|jgi:RNA polymerase sporulation-specific sigma factor|nr:SigB/SigF/SigG family RNA polymerase sigma factor [Clostridiales bacterium]